MNYISDAFIGFYYSLCGLKVPKTIHHCKNPSEFSLTLQTIRSLENSEPLHQKMIEGFRNMVLLPLNEWIIENNLLTTYQQDFNKNYRTLFLNLKNQRNIIAESLISNSDALQSIRKITPQDYFTATYIEAVFMHFLKELPDIDRITGFPGLFLEMYQSESIFFSYFTYDHAVILVWPEVFETTKDGILHNPYGPALKWGIENYYFYSGWQIPAEFYENIHKISPGMVLGEKNVEKRRAFMEILGSNRYAELLDLEIRDQSIDRFGNFLELYRTRSEDTLAGEHLQFVKVTCPSTGRNYMLCVPPHITSAREAVAWTFGKHTDDYNPTEET